MVGLATSIHGLWQFLAFLIQFQHRHSKAMVTAIHWRIAPLLFAVCLLAGCNSQYATRMRLTRQIADLTKETADLLSTIKDKPSAAAAAPKLDSLCDRMATLTEQFGAIDTEDEIYVGQEQAIVVEEHAQWIAEHSRLMLQQHRISQIPEAKAALGGAWTKLTGGMYDAGGPFGPGGAMDLGEALKTGGISPEGIRPANLPAVKQAEATK
jgi:hypothetical protein